MDSASDETLDSSNSGQAIVGGQQETSESIDAGDRHGRLLLAALLENFCRLYEADPKRAERLFLVLCKTLSAMGILDQENVEELAGVRAHYSKAFKSLMLQAKKVIDKEEMKSKSRDRKSIGYHTDQASGSDNEQSTTDEGHQGDIFSIVQSATRHSRSEWLGFEDSKYKSEFEELGLLGRGGFGAVYRVRNKMDDREYAVKKISMRRASNNHAKIYREIRTLARLEHPNIVRYFSSWLEYSRVSPVVRMKARQLRTKPVLGHQNEDMLFMMDHEDPSFGTAPAGITSDGSDDVVFEASGHDCKQQGASTFHEDDDDDDDDFVPSRSYVKHGRTTYNGQDFAESKEATADAGTQEASSMPTTRSRSDFMPGSVEDIPRAGQPLFSMSVPHTHTRFNRRRRKSESSACLTLFIQMHLCPTTLRDHIRQRNAAYRQHAMPAKSHFDSRIYIDLFRAILEGARYVHRSGLCHRDIKPSNIFLAEVDDAERGAVDVFHPASGTFRPTIPKLGDFGLVLPTQAEEKDDFEEDGVGTAIYGAPEQFARTAHQMTTKCDVFALGITFFEMLHYSGTTAMERAKLLTDLRNGMLPDAFVQAHPAEAAVILAMTCHDPSKRPSVEEILEMEIVVSSAEKERDRELRRMREENETLKARIQELEAAKAL